MLGQLVLLGLLQWVWQDWKAPASPLPESFLSIIYAAAELYEWVSSRQRESWLIACFKGGGPLCSVFLGCSTNLLHAEHPSGPPWMPPWDFGHRLWAGKWPKNAGVHAICCATWLMGSLSLTQESYDFCHHPWNSKRLTDCCVSRWKSNPMPTGLYLPQQVFFRGKRQECLFPTARIPLCFCEHSLKYNNKWVKAL